MQVDREMWCQPWRTAVLMSFRSLRGCHQEAAQSCIIDHEGANNCALQSASASGHLVGRDCLDSSEVGRIHSEPNGSDSGPNGRNVPPTSAGALLVSARSPYIDFEYGNLLNVDNKHLQEGCSCCHPQFVSPSSSEFIHS